MDTVIKNGTIVTHRRTFRSDIGIRAGKIARIAESIPGKKIIDASGMLIFPGIIDAHTHMETLVFAESCGKGIISSDDFYTGTRAAAAGGVTTIIDFTIQNKGESLKDSIIRRKRQADKKVYIDYSLHCNITDFDGNFLEEISSIIESGISGFKVFMAYRNDEIMVSDENLRLLLAETRKYGGVVQVHAENGFLLDYFVDKFREEGKSKPIFHAKSRPDYVEEEAVVRAIKLAEETDGGLYLVHLSTEKSIEAVRWAKQKSIKVFAETCPQYLLLNEGVYERENGRYYITSPPLRGDNDREALWKGIEDGIIDVIATDHCPFTCAQKDGGENIFFKIPNGLPGVETLLPTMYSEGVIKRGLELTQLVKLLCYNPARIFGLYPKKGAIEEGSDADLVIFNLEEEMTMSASSLHSNTVFSPYEGLKIKGIPEITISRGEIIYEREKFFGEKGRGQFVKAKPTIQSEIVQGT
ncbi:dihydropyrimidinase [candidate division WOR-3 bacterium JGI_Cruoil_03_44_89]|uniref:Dihydropyrimidinase n=1 Tax=candidate division WOR-3 bacterium JGI_Cruoil_03_44_89 TaxID=1973748 RepID=A0A235BMX9_UNCW3|nr:MAG: dihydropyrimidinase [candidate division WOR-3 bacterium JGI_Cruoil_03_44_89]